MGLFEHFPYTNFHELNLMWILEALKEIQTTTEQFVAINSLKYADPIQWNIVSQYEKNTIVIDSLTGTAYISVQPVPTGVALTNTDYWTVVFDLGSFVTRAAKNFTTRWEEATTLTATFSTAAGEWLVWSNTLYVALVNITAGDSYVVDGNIKRITVEEVKDDIYSEIVTIAGDLNDLNTTDKSNLVAAINEVLTTLINTSGDLADLNTTDKSNLVAAINEVLTRLINTSGDLDNLTTTDKSNLVNAINEVITTFNAAIRDLNDDLINISQFKRFGYFWEQFDTADAYPQGFCIIDNQYVVTYFQNTTTGDCSIKKSRLSDGFIVASNQFNDVCHGNTLTYIPESNEVWAVNYYATVGAGVSNIITIFDADTLNIKTTITLAGISSISCINYRNGKLFVATRDTQPQFYLYDLSGVQDQFLFTCPYAIMWLSYLKSNNRIIASNGFNLAYEFDMNGNIISAYQIPEISEDRSNYLAEIEGFDELGGVLIISDVGYKRVNDRLYRRHILNSVGVNLVYAPNQDLHALRLRSDTTMYCSNTYHTYQSGSNSNPIDSVEYAATLGGFIHTRPDIYGNNETFIECVVLRDVGTIRMRNLTIGGLVVEDSELNAAGNLIVNTSCKDMVGTYTGSSFGGILYLNRHSMVEFLNANNYLDCENDNTIDYAVWKGPDCNYLGVGSTIRNMAANTLPIVSFWSESTMFGGYFTNSNNDNPYDTLHRDQNIIDNKLRNRFGGVYGSQKLELTGVYLNTFGTRTLKAQNWRGHMLTITIWNNTYTFDITKTKRCDIWVTVSGKIKTYRFTVTITDDPAGANISIAVNHEVVYDIVSGTRQDITDSTAGSDAAVTYIELW